MMKFATCLNCMDGRVQIPVIRWIQENCGVEYVDMITEPGMDGFLSGAKLLPVDALLSKIDISLNNHGSDTIVIVGHHDCAGNPVPDDSHKANILAAVEKMKELRPFVRMIGLWVSGEWSVEKIVER